FNLLS
ncbi:fecCD transport family protein, partial [Chlamydia psittaci 08-2626_L3]